MRLQLFDFVAASGGSYNSLPGGAAGKNDRRGPGAMGSRLASRKRPRCFAN